LLENLSYYIHCKDGPESVQKCNKGADSDTPRPLHLFVRTCIDELVDDGLSLLKWLRKTDIKSKDDVKTQAKSKLKRG